MEGLSSFFSRGFFLSFSLFAPIFQFSFLQYLVLHLFQHMSNALWHINKKNMFVLFYCIQHHFSNNIRNPVISKVVFCNVVVFFDSRNHIVAYLLLNLCIHPICLLVTQNVHTNITKVQFLQKLTAIFYSTQNFISPVVSQRIPLELKRAQFAVYVGDYLLNVFHPLFVNVTVIQGNLLYFRMYSQPQSQVFHTLISNRIVIDSEFSYAAFFVHEHSAQKLASQSCNIIVHQIEIIDRVNFLYVIAD